MENPIARPSFTQFKTHFPIARDFGRCDRQLHQPSTFELGQIEVNGPKLDHSAQTFKSSIAKSGALSHRRPPSRVGSRKSSSVDNCSVLADFAGFDVFEEPKVVNIEVRLEDDKKNEPNLIDRSRLDRFGGNKVASAAFSGSKPLQDRYSFLNNKNSDDFQLSKVKIFHSHSPPFIKNGSYNSNSSASSEAEVIISDKESIADSGIINRKTVIKINEKSKSTIGINNKSDSIVSSLRREHNDRNWRNNKYTDRSALSPSLPNIDLSCGISVSISGQKNIRKDSTSRMFVRQSDSEDRSTRASAFNVRRTIEKRQLQQERRQRKALRDQIRERLRNFTQTRQRRESVSSNTSSDYSTQSNRSKSLNSLDEEELPPKSERSMFKVLSSPTLESEKNELNTYLFGSNLIDDSGSIKSSKLVANIIPSTSVSTSSLSHLHTSAVTNFLSSKNQTLLPKSDTKIAEIKFHSEKDTYQESSGDISQNVVKDFSYTNSPVIPPRRRTHLSRSTGQLTVEREERPAWLRLAKERRSLNYQKSQNWDQFSDCASSIAATEPEWVSKARKKLESMNVCITSTTDAASVNSQVTESSSAWSRGGLDALEDLREEVSRISVQLADEATEHVVNKLEIENRGRNMLEYHRKPKSRESSSERQRVSFDETVKLNDKSSRSSPTHKSSKDEIKFGDLKHDWGGVQSQMPRSTTGKMKETRFCEAVTGDENEDKIEKLQVTENADVTSSSNRSSPDPKPVMHFGDNPSDIITKKSSSVMKTQSSSKFESIAGPDPTNMTAEQLNQNVEEYDFPIPTGTEDTEELLTFLRDSLNKQELVPEVVSVDTSNLKPRSILKKSTENIQLVINEEDPDENSQKNPIVEENAKETKFRNETTGTGLKKSLSFSLSSSSKKSPYNSSDEESEKEIEPDKMIPPPRKRSTLPRASFDVNNLSTVFAHKNQRNSLPTYSFGTEELKIDEDAGIAQNEEKSYDRKTNVSFHPEEHDSRKKEKYSSSNNKRSIDMKDRLLGYSMKSSSDDITKDKVDLIKNTFIKQDDGTRRSLRELKLYPSLSGGDRIYPKETLKLQEPTEVSQKTFDRHRRSLPISLEKSKGSKFLFEWEMIQRKKLEDEDKIKKQNVSKPVSSKIKDIVKLHSVTTLKYIFSKDRKVDYNGTVDGKDDIFFQKIPGDSNISPQGTQRNNSMKSPSIVQRIAQFNKNEIVPEHLSSKIIKEPSKSYERQIYSFNQRNIYTNDDENIKGKFKKENEKFYKKYEQDSDPKHIAIDFDTKRIKSPEPKRNWVNNMLNSLPLDIKNQAQKNYNLDKRGSNYRRSFHEYLPKKDKEIKIYQKDSEDQRKPNTKISSDFDKYLKSSEKNKKNKITSAHIFASENLQVSSPKTTKIFLTSPSKINKSEHSKEKENIHPTNNQNSIVTDAPKKNYLGISDRIKSIRERIEAINNRDPEEKRNLKYFSDYSNINDRAFSPISADDSVFGKSRESSPFNRFSRERSPSIYSTSTVLSNIENESRPVSLSSILERDISSPVNSTSCRGSVSEELHELTKKYREDRDRKSRTERNDGSINFRPKDKNHEYEKINLASESPKEDFNKHRKNYRSKTSPSRSMNKQRNDSRTYGYKNQSEKEKIISSKRDSKHLNVSELSSSRPVSKVVRRKSSFKKTRPKESNQIRRKLDEEKKSLNKKDSDANSERYESIRRTPGGGWTKTSVRKTRLGSNWTSEKSLARKGKSNNEKTFRNEASNVLEKWAANTNVTGRLLKKEGQKYSHQVEEVEKEGKKTSKAVARRIVRRGSKRLSKGGELVSETKEVASSGDPLVHGQRTEASHALVPHKGSSSNGLSRAIKSSTDGERYVTQSVHTTGGVQKTTTSGVDNKTIKSLEIIGGEGWEGKRRVNNSLDEKLFVERSIGAGCRPSTVVKKATSQSKFIITKTKKKIPMI